MKDISLQSQLHYYTYTDYKNCNSVIRYYILAHNISKEWDSVKLYDHLMK